MAVSAVRSRVGNRGSRGRSKAAGTGQSNRVTWVAWTIAGGLWAFVMLAMLSFSPADPPSHAVAVHAAPVSNWGGSVGAWIAYWATWTLGWGAWILVLGIGTWMAMALIGRRPAHASLRLVGLLMVVLAVSSLHATLLPTVGSLPGAPGGLVGHTLAGVLAPSFGAMGAVLMLLVVFAVGLVIAADELVMPLPAAAWRAVTGTKGALQLPSWMRLRRSKRPAKPKPSTTRTRATAVVAEPEVEADEDWEAAEDEYEDDEYEDEDEEEYEDEDEEDDDEYEYEDEYEEDEDEEDAPEPRRRLTRAELREKISKLPVRIFSGNKNVAKDEDIVREEYEGYQFPSVDLLTDPEGDYSKRVESMVRKQAQALEESLNTFEIDAEVAGIESGPTVTLYSVQLAPGTRVARLNTIKSDLARSLGAQNIRIVPNMAGRTTVGIEVPNPTREKVRMKELISSGAAEGMTLPMFLGKDASGEPLVEDLVRMPHMLIAGTTGSGKSVCINTIIMSWLFLKRPDELKLILVDPKMVELSMFADIPHLACPVITEMNRAAAILEWAVRKMEERYELFSEIGAKDIKSFNALTMEEKIERLQPQNDIEEAKIPRSMPYIVFVIDELADLMMTNKEVEQAIVRIAQKARAVGIHLILATQRPQSSVVTGLIKSNMPCRISFKVASAMDSRIVLDAKGAELLLGHGDMMLVTPSKPDVRRAQGTLADDGESRKVVKFLKGVAGPTFERALIQLPFGGSGGDGEGGTAPAERDDLFDDAVRLMIESGRGSVSLVQRRFAIGYSRASRLVDQMAQAGILGDHVGSKAREVLISLEEWEQMQAMEADGDESEPQRDDSAEDGDDYAYEYDYDESDYDESDEQSVPDEMSGEYRN